MGANCVVINKVLAVSCCPLPDNVCTWKHRTTGKCCYTPDYLKLPELSALVGSQVPEDTEQIRSKLLLAIKAEL